jgi:hypothetical protein
MFNRCKNESLSMHYVLVDDADASQSDGQSVLVECMSLSSVVYWLCMYYKLW